MKNIDNNIKECPYCGSSNLDYIEENENINKEIKDFVIKLKDGGIQDIKYDSEHYSGCETCDYGSEYIQDFDVILSTGILKLHINQMYEYLLDEDYLMKLFLRNVDKIKQKTENEFCEWFEDNIKNKTEDNYNNTKYEITFTKLSNIESQ